MLLTNIYGNMSQAQRLSHKKATDLETKLNQEEQETNGGWFYSKEPTSHEKQFVIAVYDESSYLLGYL